MDSVGNVDWLHDQRRRLVLLAIGIEPLVSRYDPPGAKAANRFQAPLPVSNTKLDASETSNGASEVGLILARGSASIQSSGARSKASNPAIDQLKAQFGASNVKPSARGTARRASEAPKSIDTMGIKEGQAAGTVPSVNANSKPTSASFSLLMATAGRWLWLEALEDALIRKEQLQLIQAMARALDDRSVVLNHRQFDWPMSNHPHLPKDIESARQSVAGQVQRLAQESKAVGGVVLGADTAEYVTAVSGLERLELPSSIEMLREPALKVQAWEAMKPWVAVP